MLITSKKFKNQLDNDNSLKPELSLCGNRIFIYGDSKGKINDSYFLIGGVDYYNGNGKKKKIKDLKDLGSILKKNDTFQTVKNIEGSFILIKTEKNKIEIYTDKFCKKDIYYYSNNSDFVVSDSLEYFFKLNLIKDYNQISLISFFTLYGNYAPKNHTIYKNILRLRTNQYMVLDNNGLTIKEENFKPLDIIDYDKSELDNYYNILMDSVKYRSTDKGTNWIYLSSGWDSTAILAVLREIYPAKKVRGVIGEMVYSERSGVINQYEIDRAKKIAKFYDIKLDIQRLNFTDNSITSYIENIIPFMKNNSIYSFNTLNFCMLSDFIKNNASENDVVFGGEISDGVHNFGFSQYATILDHPDLSFREYADKMASYLFGPSFLKSILDDNYELDTIYNFFRQRYGADNFYSVKNKSDFKKNIELLSSFFLSPRRIPFYNTGTLSMLSEKALSSYAKKYQSEYFNGLASKMSGSNLYSIIIHLYNIFHWQGSTVKVIGKSLERYNKTIKLPFWDTGIQKFLSQMPESWGRGLDFNKTKFPLKWSLENKTNYPMHLQKGPHSYLYDSNPGFSHLAEILHGKKLNGYFKEKINTKMLEASLNDEYFNIGYIKNLITDYFKNKELSGQRLVDMGSIILFSLIQK